MGLFDRYDLTKSVKMANGILKSEHYTQPELELTMQQKKLLLFLVSKIEKNDTELQTVTIQISDYCELFGINWDGGRNKALLRKSILSLGKKCFILPIAPGREKLFRWIGAVDLDYNNGTLQIKLDESLKDFYIGVRNNYTIFQLGYTVSFTSKYSFMLYEFLKSVHKEKKTVYISADEARERFAYGKYPNFAHFRKNVLDVAIEEINEKTDITVKMALTHKGKKCENIIFYIEPKTGAELAKADKWKVRILNKTEQIKQVIDREFGEEIELNARFADPEIEAAAYNKEMSEYQLSLLEGEEWD